MQRRIVAIVLPQLACELVRQRVEVQGPLGVIFESLDKSSLAQPVSAPPMSAVLDAADDEARRYGVRPGQKVVQAAALVAHLAIHRVTFEELDAALGRVAELGMAFGTTAAVRLTEQVTAQSLAGDAPLDTVWLDITGAAHLVGGEEALLDELCDRVAALRHRVRGAIADGPRMAQALARWAENPRSIAPAGQGARAMAPLSVRALPLAADTISFLIRLGIFTLGDLAGLPRAGAAARLGPHAAEVLELVAGRDAAPLVAYTPPRALVEETCFEEGIGEVEPLLFVLRAMTSRVAARLAARGEACLELEVVIIYDQSIARLRRLNDSGAATATATATATGTGEEKEGLRLRVELPAPLSNANDLLRALKAKLERVDLIAPAVELRLLVPRIVEAHRVQLDLSRDATVSPDALPALLAELSAEIGGARVGMLRIKDAHRPEAQSQLVPIEDLDAPAPPALLPLPAAPARLLPLPVPLGKVARGAVITVDHKLYAIDRLHFVMRLDAVEWWTPAPLSRDYVRVWLCSGDGAARLRTAREGRGPGSSGCCAEAWVFIDRATGQGYLQGWCE